MEQAKKVSISSMLDESQYSKKSTEVITNPDDKTGYTSPQGVLFDPQKHEIDKKTGLPQIRSDGEFKKRRGWQGAIQRHKIEQKEQQEQQENQQEQQETKRLLHDNVPEKDGNQEYEPHEHEKFDLPNESGDYFDDPEAKAQANEAEREKVKAYIETQARLFVQVSEGILIYAIGEEWRLAPEEVELLIGPAGRCMEKYGIFELAPELELLMVAIIIGKNRLNPDTHPKTHTIWSAIKTRTKAKIFDLWTRTRWGARRNNRMTEEETQKAQAESKQEGPQV